MPRWLLCIVSGLALALTQAPLQFYALLPVGIGALFLLWHKTATPKAAFLTGWLGGLGYFAGSMFWIAEPFLVDIATFGWLIPIAVPLFAGGLALFWGAGFTLAWWASRSTIAAPFMLAASWMLFEALRGVVFTGFPWGLLGYALVDVPPIQVAAVIGITGVTLLTILVGCLAGAVFMPASGRRRVAFAAIAIALTVGSWGIGQKLLNEPLTPRSDPLLVGMVQPNVDQSQKWKPELRNIHFNDLIEKTRALSEQGADVVIWPEAATPFPIAEMADARQIIAGALRPGGVVLAGGVRVDGRGTPETYIYNSVIAVDSNADVVATYDKQHLVPFGEYVPFESLVSKFGIRSMITLPGGFTSGATQDRVITIPNLPAFVSMICYEAIFPSEILDKRVKIEWLVHVTNDAWFGSIAGPQQHLTQARVRAIERGLPLARAANTGISAMLDAKGRLVKTLGLNESGILLSALPPNSGLTIYGRFEEILFGICLMFCFALAVTLNRFN